MNRHGDAAFTEACVLRRVLPSTPLELCLRNVRIMRASCSRVGKIPSSSQMILNTVQQAKNTEMDGYWTQADWRVEIRCKVHSILTAHCLLPVAHRTLPAPCLVSIFHAVHCLLQTAGCTLRAAGVPRFECNVTPTGLWPYLVVSAMKFDQMSS